MKKNMTMFLVLIIAFVLYARSNIGDSQSQEQKTEPEETQTEEKLEADWW